MQIRVLAGLKRLMMVLAIASLIVASAHAATSISPIAATAGAPAASSGAEEVDDSAGVVERVLFARSNYVWPYSSGPVYGSVSASSWNAAGVLHTQVGSFDITKGFPNMPSELQAANRLSAQPSQYFLMQVKPEAFTDGEFDQIRQEIAAGGGAIAGELPVAAFAVRMTQAAYDAISTSRAIVALVPYPPAFKLSPEIGRTPLPQADKAASSVYSLALQLFPGESPAVVADALKAMGLKVTKNYEDVVFVDADRSKLAEIAKIDQISNIHEVLPLYLMAEETSTTVQTGRWNNGSTPYNDAGIDGGGENKASQADDQLLMIIDNGIQLDAGDLSHTRTDSGFNSSLAGNVVANHRKVAFYGTTSTFGGSGDLLGCDNSTTSGVTHGHTVAVVALGNATKVPVSYGTAWRGLDASGNFWGLDGVAPLARLIAYDGQITPLSGRCDDVTQIDPVSPTALNVGNLYTGPSTGSLPDGYTKGARVINFSWGSVANTYDANADKIDRFLTDYSDAAIFVAAGNDGRDKNTDRVPDPNTIGAPATAKNVICVGTCRNANDLGNPNLPDTRWAFSSNGPATITSQRIAPLLMAPGTDAGTLGLASEFHCRSNDNDQAITPVECDVITGQISTSFSSAAAAGAGMLVREYFGMGFYPDGTNTNPGNSSDKVSTISGALIKAILVTSADWMNLPGSNLPFGPNLTRKARGNREQGFGRIQLTNALPLQSYTGAVTGLIVGDGGPAPAGLKNDTTLNLNLAAAGTTSYTLNVCDTTQPLSIAIAWNDPSTILSDVITRNLDLEVVAPSTRKYLGNFFTDDANDDAVITGTEECAFTGQPWPPDPQVGIPLPVVDTGPWSLPSNTCTAGVKVDTRNNVEAVFLSPDSRLNGIVDDPATTTTNESTDNQIEAGAWTITVKAAGTNSGPTPYSIAIAGGACLGSAARIQRVLGQNQLGGGVLTCNESAVVTIDEIGTPGVDPVAGLTAAEIASRTKIEVVDSAGNVLDRECGVNNTDLACPSSSESLPSTDFTVVSSAGNNLSLQSRKLLLTDGTAREFGNGVLDVRDGHAIRVTYQDESPSGINDANAKRVGTASVNCRPTLAAGGIVFGQFGKDALSFVDGGCEKDERGYFTFGFPDRYMDAGELVSYVTAFQSAELGTDLANVSISLKPVVADTDSPADCKPGSVPTGACTDPNRTNNTLATAFMTVLDSPKIFGVLPAGATLTPSFTIQMAASITGTQKVDMLIGVTAQSAGKGVEALIAKREILNADEFSLHYSTDYPLGGVGFELDYDINNNEILETVTTDQRSFTNDYVFETQLYSDMTSTNPVVNTKAPWNFDTDNGGFINGLQSTSRPSNAVFAQWGEDRNFNAKLDGFCDGDTPPRIPCTQGIPASVGCRRCVNDEAIECLVDAHCVSVGGLCSPAHGTCDFALNEDRNPVNGVLDTAWGTSGGCGWQTKAPGAATGGVWHTGLIRDNDRLVNFCLATGSDPGDCQRYWSSPDGDLQGDNNWWELLLTPVLNKVNLLVDGSGDPIYQVAITDWAWNMLVDIPDTNTQVTQEFDTDINKSSGADIFNDAAFLIQFRGKQGAISGGNGPITNGFNMFARISKCVDTDGNGTPDRCGTAAGRLCSSNDANPDLECTGAQILATRGVCTVSPAQKKCTSNPNLNCGLDSDCNRHCSLALSRACNGVAGSVNNLCTLATQGTCIDDATVNGTQSLGERCVDNIRICTLHCSAAPTKPCSATEPCGAGEGTCTLDTDCAAAPAGWGGPCIFPTGNNREGVNNCEFEGQDGGPGVTARSKEPFGLANPPDDDLPNGYCSRNPASPLAIDKSIPCSSVLECNTAGAPYATVRECSGVTPPDKVCASNAECTGNGTCSVIAYTAVCNVTDAGIDEFVTDNGPGRNYGLQVSNGPDMRFTTLEDFFGDTGNSFRAALGFNNREPDVNTAGIAPGYGVAVDDMVISWKETRLDPDTHNCAGSGECATLDASSTLAYEGNSVISLTVTERTPYDPVNLKNDCNGDGDFADGTDDQDCNNNGALDVTVKLTSDAELAGEIAVLDATSPGSTVYKGNFPYSTLYNSPSSIFVVQTGTALPIVTATYDDRNDGTGAPCKNALDPTVQGQIQANTTVAANSGVVSISSYSVVLSNVCSSLTTKACATNADCGGGEGTCSVFGPGDNDGFADAQELINLVVKFVNKSGVDVDDLSASLGTSSPTIECITRSSILVGSLKDNEESNPANYLPFTFKVANVSRGTVDETLRAVFTVTVRSNRFDALTRATDIPLDLDLNATGGTGSANLNEDFEAGFGHYTFEFLDANKKSVTASNGFRCQFSDPDGLNSNSPNRADCWLGFAADPSTGVNDWHIHTTTAAGGANKGRAYSGKQSLHLGVHSLDTSSPARDTTRARHIMSIRSKPGPAAELINLPLAGANAELNFAQQVSFADSTVSNVSVGEAVEMGVVELKPSTPAGAPWIKIYPFVNVYDQQGTDDFTNCMFDPTDDGNNEDSFFDPTDPARRLGPSSTCFPEFSFTRQGQIDYRSQFDPTDIGLSSDGPGIQGCANPPNATCLPANTPSIVNNAGTWVRTRFSMVPFAGRQMSLRFIYSSIEIGTTEYFDGFFGRPNVIADDGWYIDDIRWNGLLATPISLSPDAAVIGAPLACGSCTAITPSLIATPSSLSAPGQIVSLDAKLSTADRCLNGVLQYQFWNNNNGNGVVGDAGDTLLRDWTDNSTYVDAPVTATQYAVRVRCSTALSCDSATNFLITPVAVACPTSSALASLRVSKPGAGAVGVEPEWDATITWGGTLTVDLIRGDLGTLRSSNGNTNVSPAGCLANSVLLSSINDNVALGFPGYYLMKASDTNCNMPANSGTFATGSPDELPGPGSGNRDADIALDGDACP